MLHTSVTYRIWSFMPLLLLLHASQVGGCTQIIRGKGQNFLCFQEAVMQAVHVLNTVTVPMGLQCPGLIVISPENTQDECRGFFLCNSHFFFSLFISGRMVGKANHCFTTSMGYTFCSMCWTAHPSAKRQHSATFHHFCKIDVFYNEFAGSWGERVKLSAFRNADIPTYWLWWVSLCCPTCGGL